jgi:hypothetical protein
MADGTKTEVAKRPRSELGKLEPGEGDLIRAGLAPHRAAIVEKLAELAKLGDPRSMALALQYLAPTAKPEGERIQVPGLAEAETLEAKAQAVVAAVARGQISAEAGAQALGLIQKYAAVVTADEHERRLRALEGRGAAPSKPGKAPPADVVDIDEIA